MELNNYEKYPKNVFMPEDITVNSSKYKYYLVRFGNLYDLYDYLKSNPNINKAIFRELSSRNGSKDFAGMPYDQALEDLINAEDEKYVEFVDLIKDVVNVKVGDTQKYRTIRTVTGGHLNNQLYSAGAPMCYERQEKIKDAKFVNIYSALSYSGSTSDYQLFNRAVILLSIINALEKRGYSVNLNAFEMSSCGNEVVNNMVGLKRAGSKINLQALYKTSFKKEFLRRIMFAVLETVGVQNAWGSSYGKSCNEDFVREVLKIKDKDMYFGTPQELGIGGASIEKDFATCLKKLNLEDSINVKEVDDEFREQIKKLSR